MKKPKVYSFGQVYLEIILIRKFDWISRLFYVIIWELKWLGCASNYLQHLERSVKRTKQSLLLLINLTVLILITIYNTKPIKYCGRTLCRHRGEGGAGGGATAPPDFVAKIRKLIKLKAKEVNILKILTSDLYQRCIETHSQSIPSCQPHMQFGEKTFSAFETNAYGLMGF